MSEKAKTKLRKERGISFYLYDIVTGKFIFMFDSKTFALLILNMDHRTLNNCLNNGVLYLGRFMLSFEPISEMHDLPNNFESVLTIEQLKSLVKSVRDKYKITNQKARKAILAINVKDPSSPLTGTYSGINEFARKINGDRSTIRSYLNGSKPAGSLYKNEWDLRFLNINCDDDN